MKRMIHAIFVALALALPSFAASPAQAEMIRTNNSGDFFRSQCLAVYVYDNGWFQSDDYRLGSMHCARSEIGHPEEWDFVGQQIINSATGVCLDANFAKSLSSVTVHECHGGQNQQWSRDSQGRLVNAFTGRCLVVDARPYLERCSDVQPDPMPSGTTWLRIDRILCVSPAGGINDAARYVAAIVGGVALEPLNEVPLGEGAIMLISTATVLALNSDTHFGGELSGSTDVGKAILGGLDNLFAGADDLFITVNDTKIWPANRDYADADAGDDIRPGYAAPLTGDIRLEFWEDDTFGSDSMGYITFSPSMALGYEKEAMIVSEEEGSAYLVIYSIYRQ